VKIDRPQILAGKFRGVIQENEALGASPQIRLSIGGPDREARLDISGELDMAVEREVADAIHKICADATSLTAVVVDVTEVTFIDSSGLRALIRARVAAKEVGLPFHLVCPEAGPVPRLLELARLKGWFGEI